MSFFRDPEPVEESAENKITKKRISLIGNSGVILSYEGRLEILNEASKHVFFVDEKGVRHRVFNEGGFIHIEYFNE